MSDATRNPATQCRQVKGDGERCRVKVDLSTDGLCLWHDPERATLAKEVQVRGGYNSRNRNRAVTVKPTDAPSAPKSLEDCVAYASWLTHAVVVGDIDSRTCKEAIAAVREVRMALEKRDLERMVEELKAQLKAEKARKGLRAS